MTAPSFVVDAAADAVRQAADELATPLAPALAADAAALVLDPPKLAVRLTAVIAEVEDRRLAGLALDGLTLRAVPETTANRRLQAKNQAALVDLVRNLATVRLAESVGRKAFLDRLEAVSERDAVSDALDARAATASTDTFRALRTLRSAVVNHVTETARDLPDVVEATPAAIRPSLALAYEIYGDVARSGQIVARNRLARPGFVPSSPIEILAA